MKCPCCNGSGEIKEHAPVYLSPMQFKVYDTIRRSPHGITGPRLVDKVYADRHDGGPDYASVSVHVMIKRINDKLKGKKQQIWATNRGRGGVFKLVHDVV